MILYVMLSDSVCTRIVLGQVYLPVNNIIAVLGNELTVIKVEGRGIRKNRCLEKTQN